MGTLFTLGFAPFNFWPLTIISLGGYFFLLQSTTYRQAILIGFFYGIGIYLTGISWLFVSIYYQGNIDLIWSLIITGVFITLLAIYNTFQAIIYKFFETRSYLDALLVFPVSWIFIELIRGFLFTGFPWLVTGVVLGDTFLDGFMPIIGASGNTLYIAILAGVLNLIIAPLKKRPFNKLLIISVLVMVISGNLTKNIKWTNPVDSIDVSIYQPNLTLEKKWSFSGIEKTKEMMERAIDNANNSELIIFPETALIFNESVQKEWLDSIAKKALLKDVGLITGIIDRIETKEVVSSKIRNRLKGYGAAEGVYDKTHLVPFGEYIPFFSFLGPLLDILKLKLTNTEPGSSYHVLKFGNIRISPSICYEIAFSNLVLKTAINSDLLVTISNDTWFGRSIGPEQHLEIAQTRAIEHQKPLLRATNSGISAIVDKKGKIIAQQGFFEEKKLRGQIIINKGTTFYSKYGNIPLYALIILSFLIMMYLKITKVSKN